MLGGKNVTCKFSMHKHSFAWDELESLPRDQVAALAIVCFAISEINVFRRIYMFGGLADSDDEDIRAAIIIQKLTILR